ncbi:MAG: PEP-CTERM sorting domain-containing protein, partial [Planctomycetes bacterium]|nr:PEP-CTERM sorting domain-containing protein [Planctomycetota bacterium]
HPFLIVYGTVDDYDGLVVDTQDFQARSIKSTVFDFNTAGDWAHVVVVRNGDASGDMDVYVNGVDLSPNFEFSLDSYSTPSAEPHIGARTAAFNPGWGALAGDLDEFVYWNRSLTAAEAAALYTAAITPGGLDGDYNNDGKVDAADFVVWRKTDGSQAGYDTWRANFGNALGSGAAVGSAAGVPEPASIALIVVAGCLGIQILRSKRN